MKPTETIAVAEWMRHPAATAVLSVLSTGGHRGRFVGGAVRNHLLGLPVTDALTRPAAHLLAIVIAAYPGLTQRPAVATI